MTTYRTTYIYGLRSPLDGKIHYVGQSSDPVNRFKQHLSESTPKRLEIGMRPQHRWIRSLLVHNETPQLVILEEMERQTNIPWGKDSGALPSERTWIRRLKAEGHPLKNQCHESTRAASEVEEQRILEQAKQRGREMFGGEPPELVKG